jgi:peptidoglycan hydrolase-like protein with peptidoglycan-binding domain
MQDDYGFLNLFKKQDGTADKEKQGFFSNLFGSGGGSSTPAVDFSAKPELRRGARGEAVTDLQRILNELSPIVGHPPINVDGDFGNNTENAVRALQTRRNVPVTGAADRTTWNAMAAAFNAQAAQADAAVRAQKQQQTWTTIGQIAQGVGTSASQLFGPQLQIPQQQQPVQQSQSSTNWPMIIGVSVVAVGVVGGVAWWATRPKND